jgi:hypothetical protein
MQPEKSFDARCCCSIGLRLKMRGTLVSGIRSAAYSANLFKLTQVMLTARPIRTWDLIPSNGEGGSFSRQIGGRCQKGTLRFFR